MEQERGVLVSPSAEVPVIEGEVVTAIRELTNRGWGAKAIAAELAIARNTVRRYRRGAYRAAVADAGAWRRSRRPQPCRLSTRPALRRAVAQKLAQHWSPQQISGWLRRTFPSDPDRQVSPETIYRSLFVQSRGALKRRLVQHLRRQHHFRHARAAAHGQPRPGQIIEAVSIRQRPAEVHDRAVPGH